MALATRMKECVYLSTTSSVICNATDGLYACVAKTFLWILVAVVSVRIQLNCEPDAHQPTYFGLILTGCAREQICNMNPNDSCCPDLCPAQERLM